MAAAQNMAMTTTQKIIAIAVTIIIISTVALPIIDDVQHEQRSTANNADMALTAISGSKATVAIINNSGTITVGGYDVTSNPANVIFYSEDLIIAHISNSLRCYAFDAADPLFNVTIKSCNIVNGDYTVTTAEDQTHSGSITGTCLYAAESGSYALFAYNTGGAKIDASSVAYSCVLASKYVGSDEYSVQVAHGSITNGFVSDVAAYYDTTDHEYVNYSNSSVSGRYVYSEDEGYYTLNGFDYTVSSGGSTYSYANSNCIIVPLEYHYISSEDLGIINLFSVVAIMLILVPLMMAVRMMTLKRN